MGMKFLDAEVFKDTFGLILRIRHPGDVARTRRSRTRPWGALLAHCGRRAEGALLPRSSRNIVAESEIIVPFGAT
jgi:hypothetical protein